MPATNRFHVVNVLVVIAVWGFTVRGALLDPDAVEAVASTLEGLAAHATLFGAIGLGIVWLGLRLSREGFADLGYTTRDLAAQLGVGLACGVGLFALHALSAPLIDALLPAGTRPGIDLAPLFGDRRQLPLWIFLAVFKGGLAEETTRIFALTRFERLFGRPGLLVAVVVGAIVFGIAHLYQGVDTAIGTGIQAVLFAGIWLRRRRALEPVVAHATYDVIQIALAYATL